jgi:chromosome partitioning protein
MGRVIVVANQKGGVGKTTTVINLGAALAERDRRVLLIDIDPQAGLTASFGVDPYQLKTSTYALLMDDDVTLERVVQPIEERLWLVPAGVDLAAADYSLTRFKHSTQRLRQAIGNKSDAVDFVLIDTPPSLGLLTVNGLVAADELLVPVGCQYLAMRGIRALLETVWLVQKRVHPDLDLLGLLPTMFRRDSEHSRLVVTELRAVFQERVFQTVIDVDEAVMAAPAARKSVLAYRPRSSVADAYRSLAEEVIRADSLTQMS